MHKRLSQKNRFRRGEADPASDDDDSDGSDGGFSAAAASSSSASASAPTSASSAGGRKKRRGGGKGALPAAASSATSAASASAAASGRIRYTNKQRCLVLCSRGAVAQYRHLMGDIRRMLPHHKKEVKLDTKRDLALLNEICEMKSCNTCLFFEFRKRQDLYLWMSCTPNGPSCKFLVHNVHTMDELKLTGNCLMGSRPLLCFDGVFDQRPQLRLLKEMLTQVFGTPEGHPKSKPFIDHVFNFSYLDGRIWFRNYQIVEESLDERSVRKAVKGGQTDHNKLIEIGPRFVLNPIRMFEGSFGGRTLYSNPRYESPNVGRREEKRRKGGKYAGRLEARQERRGRAKQNVVPRDAVGGRGAGVWKD